MDSVHIPERRNYRRYIVQGQAELTMGLTEVSGEIVNVSEHGVLIRTEHSISPGAEFKVCFRIPDYPVAFEGEVKVLGTNSQLVACGFLTIPACFEHLMVWLAENNYPWTANYSSDLLVCERNKVADRGHDTEMQTLLSQLHQLG